MSALAMLWFWLQVCGWVSPLALVMVFTRHRWQPRVEAWLDRTCGTDGWEE